MMKTMSLFLMAMVITITVLIGINDDPVAQDDVGVIVEGSTLTVANSDNANETNDSGYF